MIISRAPFRLSLFGGGTDYPGYFSTEPSVITAAAMDKYCYLTLRALPPFFDTHITRLVYSRIEAVQTNNDLSHPTARACLVAMGIESGLEIHYDGDLPARSGIGSSSAFTVALVAAINRLKAQKHSTSEITEQVLKIEHNIVGESTGIQDQIIAAQGGVKVISCGPDDNISVRNLLVSDEYLKLLSDSILVGFYGAQRDGAEHSNYLTESIKSGKNKRSLDLTRQLSFEALELLEAEKSMGEIGGLLKSGWQLKRRMMQETNSLDPLNNLFEKAQKLGSHGGKLMGAGGSGFFYLLVDRENQQKVRDEFQEIKFWTNIQFDKHGVTTWNLSEDGSRE